MLHIGQAAAVPRYYCAYGLHKPVDALAHFSYGGAAQFQGGFLVKNQRPTATLIYCQARYAAVQGRK